MIVMLLIRYLAALESVFQFTYIERHGRVLRVNARMKSASRLLFSLVQCSDACNCKSIVSFTYCHMSCARKV
jgi:hypothetical protein